MVDGNRKSGINLSEHDIQSDEHDHNEFVAVGIERSPDPVRVVQVPAQGKGNRDHHGIDKLDRAEPESVLCILAVFHLDGFFC